MQEVLNGRQEQLKYASESKITPPMFSPATSH
jgi:hypothetical protein